MILIFLKPFALKASLFLQLTIVWKVSLNHRVFISRDSATITKLLVGWAMKKEQPVGSSISLIVICARASCSCTLNSAPGKRNEERRLISSNEEGSASVS